MNINRNIEKKEVIYEAYVHYDPDLIRDWVDTYIRNTCEVHNDYFYYIDIDEEEYLVYIDDVIDATIYHASRGRLYCNDRYIDALISGCPLYRIQLVPLQ